MSKRGKGEIPTKRLNALVFQGQRLSQLRCGGLVQIEADNLYPGAVHQFQLLLFCCRGIRGRDM
jgi:hypothetical protein